MVDFLFISSFLVYFVSVLFTFCLFCFGFQNFQMKTKPLPKKTEKLWVFFCFFTLQPQIKWYQNQSKNYELYFKHDNIAVPPPYEPPPPPSKNSSNASLINWKAAGLRQGLLYRWTEHSADFFLKKLPLGEGKRPPQITPQGWIFWTMIFYNLKKFT